MGKQSKAQEAEERRKYMEARRREEETKQKQQNRMLLQITVIAIAVILIVVVVAVALAVGGNKDDGQGTTEPAKQNTVANPDAVAMDTLNMTTVNDLSSFAAATEGEITDHVQMSIRYTDKNGVEKVGTVVVRLFADVAPKTVANFQKLVSEGFYTNVPMHRIIKGFMIQGGDPDGDGASNSGEETIAGEFTSNGWQNNLLHVRGVISMARTEDPNSASTQFFIVHETSDWLDNEYASFGYVVYGMDTVDGIANTELKEPEIPGEKPSKPVNPVTIEEMHFVKLQ